MIALGPLKIYTTDQQERVEMEFPASSDALSNAVQALLGHDIPANSRTSRLHGHAYYRAKCLEAAEHNLADYLFDLCEKPGVTFTRESFKEAGSRLGERAPWYFPRVCSAILDFMDAWKKAEASKIAETAITREINQWLETALRTKRTVMFTGNSRFGKTEAIKSWCAQRPGVARLVRTPSTNAESDLLRETAAALGIMDCPSAGYGLRTIINQTLVHSGLMLILDEAQFLIPENYSKNTGARRLNWFRENVMEKGIASALVATPQYKDAKDKFVKTTRYNIAQFDERVLHACKLPSELDTDDLMAIARIHFPKLNEAYLSYVVKSALATERNYVSDIERIATIAKDRAGQAGRELPNMDDIKAGIAGVLPTPEPDSQPKPSVAGSSSSAIASHDEEEGESRRPSKEGAGECTAKPLQTPCKHRARPVRTTSPANSFSSHNRNTTPAELPG